MHSAGPSTPAGCPPPGSILIGLIQLQTVPYKTYHHSKSNFLPFPVNMRVMGLFNPANYLDSPKHEGYWTVGQIPSWMLSQS